METSYTYYPALKDTELAEGTIRGVVLNGVEVLLARVDGQVYAMANRCGHMNIHLSEGSLTDHVVECPLHGARYDLRSGAIVRTAQQAPDYIAAYGPKIGKALSAIPTKPITTFAVRVVAGVIEVGIPGSMPTEPMAEPM